MNTIDYEESFGEIKFPENFAEKLRDKTLEEQMECYRITEITEISSCSYGEQGRSRRWEKVCSLAEYSGCRKLVVEDGLLVGVTILAYGENPGPACPIKEYASISAVTTTASAAPHGRTVPVWIVHKSCSCVMHQKKNGLIQKKKPISFCVSNCFARVFILVLKARQEGGNQTHGLTNWADDPTIGPLFKRR